MYVTGRGVPQDYAAAVIWFRKAAEQGYAFAQSNLGVLYRDGRGVTQDFADAMIWFRKAAEQGHRDAKLYLGVMYVEGRGVTQDYVLAHMWFNLSAEQGEQKAVAALEKAERRVTPAQIVEAQTLARDWKATKQPSR